MINQKGDVVTCFVVYKAAILDYRTIFEAKEYNYASQQLSVYVTHKYYYVSTQNERRKNYQILTTQAGVQAVSPQVTAVVVIVTVKQLSQKKVLFVY